MTTDIIIQAATDAALASLLLQHGLLVTREGSISPAPGVTYSPIGDAFDEAGVQLLGRYAWIGIDDDVFGSDAAASLLLNIDDHRYKGPSIRRRLGGNNYDDSAVVPRAVTMQQFRDELIDRGLDDTVEAVINAIPDAKLKKRVRSRWEYSGAVFRNNETAKMIQQALKWSEDFIDELFIGAAKR